MPRRNQRATENAWRQRDVEAGQHQARAAGLLSGVPPTGGGGLLGGQGGHPTNVHIVSGGGKFFEDLKRALGFAPNTGGPTAAGGPLGNLDSLKAVLTDQQAIMQANKEIARDLQVASRMVLDFTGQAAREFSSHQSAMREMRKEERDHMQELLDLMQEATQQQIRAAQVLSTMTPPGGGGGRGHGGGVPGGGGGYAGAPHGHAEASYGQLRNSMVSAMHSAMGTANAPTMQPIYDNNGQLHHYVAYHPDGRRQVVQPNDPALPSMLAQSRKRGVTNNIIQGANQGGVLGAARAIPGLGALVETGMLANKAATWITTERAKNAPFQAVYGGSNASMGGALSSIGDLLTGHTATDTSGLGQRIQEEGFVLGQRFSGGMTSDQARQAFEGVSALGYSGGRRDTALDFISSQYKQLGMDIGQSLQLVQVSAQYANQGLAGVSSGLQSVTQAAQQTGQSAVALQQSFAQTYGQALQAGMGAGSASLAQAMTMSTAGTSRDLSGISYGNMLTNPVLAQRVAATGGLTLGQMESQVSQGNIQAFTRPAQQIINQTLTGSMDQRVRDAMNVAINQQGGYGSVAQSPGAQYSVAQAMMQTPSWNVMAARAALGTMGIQTQGMSDEQIAEYYVATLTSGGLGAQANAQQNANRLTPLPAGQGSNQHPTAFVQGLMGRSQNTPNLLDTVTKLWGGDTATHNAENLQGITSAYQSYEQQNKVSNPAIESMINTLGTDSSTMIRVHTSSGDRVVSMGDAIKYYSDQLSTGSAYVVGGQNNGKRLSDVTGVTDQGFTAGQTPGTTDTSTKPAVQGIGQSWQDYQKNNPGNANPSGNGPQSVGTVTVSPSPELMQMFHWNSTGGVNINGAAAAGVPPTVGGGR